MKIRSLVFLAVASVLMTACASSVERRSDAASYRYGGEKYGQVTLVVDPGATRDPNDLVRFEAPKLKSMLERGLEAGGLFDPASPALLKVNITDIRIRSTFNAFMWGIMAGDDHIVGEVSLIDPQGAARHAFKVSATYALGGFAGMNETRMGWLYDEFVKLTLAEIKKN